MSHAGMQPEGGTDVQFSFAALPQVQAVRRAGPDQGGMRRVAGVRWGGLSPVEDVQALSPYACESGSDSFGLAKERE